jgi:uncharacterized delta-60 repeat protein
LSNGYDKANSIKVDGSGNVYVTGESEVGSITRDYVTVKYNSSGVQQWAARYNGPGNYIDQATCVAIDNSGNVYVTGGSVGMGTGSDFCTIKYNSNGDSLWVRRYNGTGNDIDASIQVVVDVSGNVYVTGFSDDGVNLNYVTIKYNSSGTQLWASIYNGPAGGTGSEDRPHFLAVDGIGNVYVTGESSTGTGSLDMYATIKYNSSGDSLWVARYKGPGVDGLSQAYALAVDAGGNVYVTGRSDPTSGFGFNFDILTIKYNSSGDSLWVKRYNGPGNSSDIGNSIALDGGGNIIVTGASVVNTFTDFCTIKYNSSGDTLWISRYNGPAKGVDNANSIATDALNNVYVTGYSVGSGSGDDYATVKYNSSGVQQWVMRYNGPGNSMDQSNSVVVDVSGNVYVTGGSNGSGSGSDYATIKYSQPNGIHQISSETPQKFNLFQNYPNPFNPATKIRFDIPASDNVVLKIYDLLGSEVSILINRYLHAGKYEIEFNASELSSGAYFYGIESGKFSEIKKMIVIK